MNNIADMNFDNLNSYHDQAKKQFDELKSGMIYLQQKIDGFVNIQQAPSSEILENNAGLAWFVLEPRS